MIRVLAMVAVAGFLVSAVTLSIAVGIAGPGAILHHNAWTWGSHGWGWRHGRHFHEDRDDGPQTTREIAWSGGSSLDISVPADVEYTQTDGPAKVVVTGAAHAVEDVVVEDGHIRYADDDSNDFRRLKIVVTAPSVTDFNFSGSETASIAGYRQDRLSVSVSGYAEVKAAGEARETEIDISGAGHADLGALKTKAAKVEISGSGDASIAPTESADVEISGLGSATLLTNPPRLHTNITGAGQIHRPGA